MTLAIALLSEEKALEKIKLGFSQARKQASFSQHNRF